MKTYLETEAVLFIREMNDAGLPTFDYEGRRGYKGPAVKVATGWLSDIFIDQMKEWGIHTQTDDFGKGKVLYLAKNRSWT